MPHEIPGRGSLEPAGQPLYGHEHGSPHPQSHSNSIPEGDWICRCDVVIGVVSCTSCYVIGLDVYSMDAVDVRLLIRFVIGSSIYWMARLRNGHCIDFVICRCCSLSLMCRMFYVQVLNLSENKIDMDAAESLGNFLRSDACVLQGKNALVDISRTLF
jgi:hypothetical protein